MFCCDACDGAGLVEVVPAGQVRPVMSPCMTCMGEAVIFDTPMPEMPGWVAELAELSATDADAERALSLPLDVPTAARPHPRVPLLLWRPDGAMERAQYGKDGHYDSPNTSTCKYTPIMPGKRGLRNLANVERLSLEAVEAAEGLLEALRRRSLTELAALAEELVLICQEVDYANTLGVTLLRRGVSPHVQRQIKDYEGRTVIPFRRPNVVTSPPKSDDAA